MNGQPRKRQDFSDIDNLERAHESFMREQRRALEKRKVVRAPRPLSVWLRSHTKQISVVAALVLVCAIALFAGIKLSGRGDALRQPEESSSETRTETQTSAAESETASQPGSSDAAPVTEDSKESTTAKKKTKADKPADTVSTPAVTATTVSETAKTISTAPEYRSAEPVISSAPTVTTTAVTQVPERTTMPAVTTRSTTSATVTTSASRSTASTSKSTASTTQTTPSTSRSTASSSRTTQSTTKTTASTTKSTTKVTTTTPEPKASVIAKNISITNRKKYGDNQQEQTVKIQIYNNSGITYSGSTPMSFSINSSYVLSHIGCTSYNASNIVKSGGTVYFNYTGTLNAWSYETISIRIISDYPILTASLG